jgi:DNA-binding MarR family transcriptional regulator
MRSHRSAGNARPAAHGGGDHDELQRRLLLELVSNPPAEGDRLDDLVRRLDAPRERVQAAIDALADAGLARRDTTTAVRASAAALRFDALWPTI